MVIQEKYSNLFSFFCTQGFFFSFLPPVFPLASIKLQISLNTKPDLNLKTKTVEEYSFADSLKHYFSSWLFADCLVFFFPLIEVYGGAAQQGAAHLLQVC